jgi:hypothetical protein
LSWFTEVFCAKAAGATEPNRAIPAIKTAVLLELNMVTSGSYYPLLDVL